MEAKVEAGVARLADRAHGKLERWRPARSAMGLALALVATMPFGLSSGTSAATGKRPAIHFATATYRDDLGKVAFSVETERHTRKVVVFHAGVRLPAKRAPHLKHYWQTQRMQAAKRNCYRIRVKARNGNGVTTRRMRAGRIGSKGCS